MDIFKNPRLAGAIVASGNELSELITDLAELRDAHTIVEFGPGTGVFTRAALKKMRPDAFYLALENDPAHLPKLRAAFPTVHIHEDAAASIGARLHEHGKTSCDRIISGLPWAVFNERIQRETLDAAYRALRPGGIFVTFAYIHSPVLPAGKRFRKLLEETFGSVQRSRIVWKNLPPAFVYICRK